MSVGKQKEPISMERLTSGTLLPNQERAAVSDAMLPARNTGIVWSGGAFNQRMSWAGGVFNNFIESDESIGNTATQVVGRITGLPFKSADESNLLHLGIGYRYSNAKQGIQYLTEPEVDNAPIYVDTQFITDAEDFYTVDLEAAVRRGPVIVSAEYVKSDINSVSANDPTFSQVSGLYN